MSIIYREEKLMEDQLREKGFVLNVYKGELENIILTNDFFNRIKMMEFCSFFFGWLGLGSCMIHYEYEYIINSGDSTNPDLFVDSTHRILKLLLYINLLCTIFVIFSIYFRYVLTLK
jgi:hypothetical protein